ncbi:hypothetical protein M9H77_11475 [Catharanthus roseus]|uniref:Uncharacterized protein n=1 Tax=Catharanthus roseus TaxID=4058 RepID=A0ACC0BEQ7_CATRO|nr:hypothetical protein M9H77_11475 [Catharanthus roseus]
MSSNFKIENLIILSNYTYCRMKIYLMHTPCSHNFLCDHVKNIEMLAKPLVGDPQNSDCPKAIEKEKGALEAKLEALKKKKKGKGLIRSWDQDSSESEGEEKPNLRFMVLENEVQSSPSNLSSLVDDDDDDDDDDLNSLLIKIYYELGKITKKNKELKNKIDNQSNENSKLVCKNKTLFESLDILKKEKDFSKLQFQKLVLENKNICEKVLSLEKWMVDYNNLKKKVSDLTLCVEKFTKGKENFEKLLGSQRSPFEKNDISTPMRSSLKLDKDEKGKKVDEKRYRGAPDKFIYAKEAVNFEEWTRNRRKITVGHRVDLNDMQGMEAIPNLFDAIGWTPLFIVNQLYYTEMIYEFYANLHKGRVERDDNIPHQWVLLGL